MQRLLPHPLGPCRLGTCLSAAAWSGGQSSAPCELPETPGSNRFVALTKLPGNPHLRTGHRRPWSSPGRDPSISSGEGLAHVAHPPPTLARLLSTATPSQPTAPVTATRNPGGGEGCRGGHRQGVGCVRGGSGAHGPEPGDRARSLRESFTGKRTEEEGDSGLGPLIYAKENPIHDRRQMAHGHAKRPTMPGCELGPIPHRQGAFLKGRRLRGAKRPEGVSRGPRWAPHLR